MMSNERPHHVIAEPGVDGLLQTCIVCGYVGTTAPPLPCPGPLAPVTLQLVKDLQPGSKVLLTTERSISADHAQRIKVKDGLSGRFPDVEFTIAVGVRVGAVTAPQEDQ